MRYKLYSHGILPVLQVNAIGYSADIKDTSFGPMKRDCYIICYVLSGKGFYNGIPLGKGEGFIVTPDITEHIYPNKIEPWEILWFISIDSKMKELFKSINYNENYIFRHNCPDELMAIKSLSIAENRMTISDSKMLELFFSVFKYHDNEQTEPSSNKTAAEKYLDFSINYIKSNISGNITVENLTNLLGVSQPYLYKIFKEALGKSPKSFIIDQRIKIAKEMLIRTEFPVAQIAYSVGFSDSFAFSKSFSLRTGLSPTEYRKSKGK